jgi:cell division protein FtsQ
MRRVTAPRNLEGAKRLLLRRRLQRYLPRRPGRLIAVSVLTVSSALGVVAAIDQVDRGSRLETTLLTSTAALGLIVRTIEVSGYEITPRDDVMGAVAASPGTPILAVSPILAKLQLESLPWVKSAVVERRLPDTLVVRVTERRPLALWQNHGHMALVDTDCVVVTTEHLDRWANLLLVVGENAPPHAGDLLSVLTTEPALRARVQSAVWVGDRRWNLIFDEGITVEMPETGLAEAWARLARIERGHGLLARDITKVDLRLPDRVAVTPTQSAAKPVKPQAKPAGKPT